MKKIFCLVLLLFLTSGVSFALEENLYEFNRPEQDMVEENYVEIEESVWEKYFQNVSYILKKRWLPKKAGLQYGYNDSYVRLLLFMDKFGNLLSYKVMGTCLPVDDEKFLNYVKEILDGDLKFEPLPEAYGGEYIVFTAEFHFKLHNSSHVQWIPKRYGTALVQIADNTRKYQVQGIE